MHDGHVGEWRYSFTPLPLYPRYPFLICWVGPRAGLDAVKNRKILHYRESHPDRLTYSPSLRLSYPDSKPNYTRIREISGSKLGSETGYLEKFFEVFVSVSGLPGE
jgi:hypothetical protein